jgi:hypothetical protein
MQGIPGAQRMVMGHTIQQSGINAVCGGKALRVDVGMSKGCGDGEVEVLEIRKDGAQVRQVCTPCHMSNCKLIAYFGATFESTRTSFLGGGGTRDFK